MVEKRNFSRGIFTPELYSRKDVDLWRAGVKEAKNVVMLRRGGMQRRMGTRLVWKIVEDNVTRPIPFTYSGDESYLLLFGQATMRPFYRGGTILETEFTILSITKASNALVGCTNHDYSVGDQVFFWGVEGMTEINGKFGIIQTTPDADSFTVDIDTTNFSTFTGSGGGITNPGTPAPPPPPPVPPAPPPPPPPPSGGGGTDYPPDEGPENPGEAWQ